jgi:hypothetical protein
MPMTPRRAAALRRARFAPQTVAPSVANDVSLPCPPDANMARKMAIVDALIPTDRALVHEIGLYDFAKRYPLKYACAKARARVKGHTEKTQRCTSTLARRK